LFPIDEDKHLADTRVKTFILRLVLNKRGQVIHGELVDVTSAQTKRFKNWNELIRALSNHCKARSERADEIAARRS
jgi:hypothetical protein